MQYVKTGQLLSYFSKQIGGSISLEKMLNVAANSAAVTSLAQSSMWPAFLLAVSMPVL